MNEDDWYELKISIEAMLDKHLIDRLEDAVNRYLPKVDEMIQRRISERMKEPTSWADGDKGGDLSKWIKQQAESAADHYIRLFGGAPALREIVGSLWDAKKEEYVRGEIHRRLEEIKKRLMKES